MMDIPETTDTATLGVALEAFFAEHGSCGGLETEVDDASVSLWCSCGARLLRAAREVEKGKR